LSESSFSLKTHNNGIDCRPLDALNEVQLMAPDVPAERDTLVQQERDEELVLRRWASSSRCLSLMTIQAAGDPEPMSSPQPPKKRISQADKDALLTAALILLVIAGAAFFAGLL
jgi:hypothetical protein